MKNPTHLLIFVFVSLATLNGCGNTDAQIKPNADRVVLDPQKPEMSSLKIGLSGEEIENLELPFEKSSVMQEGDDYVTYAVEVIPDATAVGLLNFDGTLARISTTSERVTDGHGLGVGSAYKELRDAYPNGKLLHGLADGRYANFVFGAYLMFGFDPITLPEGCFEFGETCNLSDDLLVNKLTINSEKTGE